MVLGHCRAYSPTCWLATKHAQCHVSAVTLFYTLCAVLQELGVIQRDYTSEYFNMSGLSFSQIYIRYTMQWWYIRWYNTDCLSVFRCEAGSQSLATSTASSGYHC